MAKTTTINTDQSSPYELDQSDHRWILAESHLLDGDPDTVHQASTLTNDTLIINGRVISGDSHGAGIMFEGSNSRIVVSEIGSVFGATGIDSEGDNNIVRNDGIVFGESFAPAIYMAGANAHVINNGELNSGGGIEMNSVGGLIENNGTINAYLIGVEIDAGSTTVDLGTNSVITALDQGIEVTTTAGEKTNITNDGVIAVNDETAIGGSDGDEVVVNHGTIRGYIWLGAGNDVFNNLDGKYSGDIFGGAGDDIFIVHSARTQINELSGEGVDTVKSTVSFSLNTNALMASEIENLTLLGTRNLDASGNDQRNMITGNSGDNILSGGTQNDQLIGAKGHDTFVFATNFDSDEVSDFHPGVDKVDLSGMTDIANFKDMLKHHVSVAGNDLHIASGADDLILDHTSKADLHASDFIF